MTIEVAILGLLNQQPLSGYDLKKIFVDSSLFYWSGNNNQVYRTLIQLHQQGLVESEVQLQESLPAKKVYTITAKGRAELKKALLAPPEPPEMRNTLLIRLACADLLDEDELDGLLARYEDEMEMHLRMEQEKAHRQAEARPAGTGARAGLVAEMISENLLGAWEHELGWVRRLREQLRAIR